MKALIGFDKLYQQRKELPKVGWIYIKENDFEDLENSTYYIIEEGEDDPDDLIDTEDNLIPRVFYEIDNTILSLIEIPTFNVIIDRMISSDQNFKKEDHIEAIYHFVEEDTFLY